MSDCCAWKGLLKDLHEHEKVCGYKKITCPVEGCAHQCRRNDLDGHLSGMGMIVHMNLMKQSIVNGCEEKMKVMESEALHRERLIKSNCNEQIKKVEARCNEKVKALKWSLIQTRYINDCRSWVEYKPDALFDVSIWQIKTGPCPRKIVGLLCEIPGPLGSAWEGARIPMMLRYVSERASSPPQCLFPKDFFHVNVSSNGLISLSTLIETREDGLQRQRCQKYSSLCNKCLAIPHL